MARLHIEISDEYRQLLTNYWRFYRDLESGARCSDTPQQRHFVAVCRGECEPETDHESAYLLGRRLAEHSTLSEKELVEQNFHVSARDMKDARLPTTKDKRESFVDHAVDVERFSAKRRWVRQYNW